MERLKREYSRLDALRIFFFVCEIGCPRDSGKLAGVCLLVCETKRDSLWCCFEIDRGGPVPGLELVRPASKRAGWFSKALGKGTFSEISLADLSVFWVCGLFKEVQQKGYRRKTFCDIPVGTRSGHLRELEGATSKGHREPFRELLGTFSEVTGSRFREPAGEPSRGHREPFRELLGTFSGVTGNRFRNLLGANPEDFVKATRPRRRRPFASWQTGPQFSGSFEEERRI